jgi:hypothetical protein
LQINALSHARYDGDWVYESCHIAVTLWATAISHKTSLTEAATLLERRGSMEAPVSKLVYALHQTDLSKCWDNMAGVLLWMSMIGGAAAKLQQEKSSLLAVAMRCIIVLLPEHRFALLDSLRKLLKVMQLWTDGRTGQ